LERTCRKSAASWFETRGFAALLTMTVCQWATGEDLT
jgi:hypothetical protein